MKKLRSISEFSKNKTVKKSNISSIIHGGASGGNFTCTNYSQTGPDKLHDCGDGDSNSKSSSEPASSSPVN
ncbi:hypothetical protein [Kordia sp.]|uniref:hypothetical protein n=1 Tax=Kordia sp. TaxID=1965332 RepID=UPI003D6AFD94